LIAIEHWHRILDGEPYAASSRIQWALLLRRTYGVDALRCPTCSGRLRVMATLTEPGTVKKILAHLALPTEPLPRSRARDPRLAGEFRLRRCIERAAIGEAAEGAWAEVRSPRGFGGVWY
jgi:hypothetical protein